jgi:hypothetical protein
VVVLAAACAISASCGGDDFCSPGSYECSGNPQAGASAAGAGGSKGGAGGFTGQGGFANAGSAGSLATGGMGAATGGSTGQGGTSAASGGTAPNGGENGAGEGGEGGAASSSCEFAAPTVGCVLAPGSAGIYVAPNGADANDGTQSSPVATIGHALELAAASQAPIFVCEGVYDEHVEVSTDDVAIHGSFRCADSVWTYDPTKRTRITPSTPDEALRVTKVKGLDLMDLELVAGNATATGASSVAVFVSNSDGVTFTRVHAVAGKGTNGADGTLDAFSYGDVSVLHGNDAMNDSGGEPNYCSCDASSEHTRGAPGGDAGQDGGTGEPTDLGGGEPGIHGTVCTNGGPGHDAPAADDGSGAKQSGSITEDGWTAESGSDGPNGRPGQGGGGGGGGKLGGDGGGGGGACGGCGGKGGGGGGGGGSSIAVLAFESDLTLRNCVLESGSAGNGGNGVLGQVGQDGGVGGNRTGSACVGGNGGQGGMGGPGGGGAGGIAVGVVWSTGHSVNVDDASTITPGTAGDGGLGAGSHNDGLPGVAQATLQI